MTAINDLPHAVQSTDAAVVACPECQCDTKVFQPSTEHDCECCGARFAYVFDAPKDSQGEQGDFAEFAGWADNLTLKQMAAFQSEAERVLSGLRKMEQMTGSPEPLSDYIGMSYSHIVEQIEELSVVLDARMTDIQGFCEKVTISYIDDCPTIKA